MLSIHFPRSGSVVVTLLAFLLCLCCLSASVHAEPSGQVKLNTTKPLFGVPFAASSAKKLLYLSPTNRCDVDKAVGKVCATGGTCEFLVPPASTEPLGPVDVARKLYWCGDVAAGARSFDELSVNPMAVMPPYVFYSKTTQLTFADAPVGTIVNFFVRSDCKGDTINNANNQVLGQDRTAVLTMPAIGNVVYACSKPSDTAAFQYGSTIYASPTYILTANTEGFRYTTVEVNASATFTSFSLSKSEHCIPLSQDETKKINQARLPISVPRGEYYFCAQTVSDSAVFVPSETKFTVKEFGIEPTHMYTGMDTNMRLTLDANPATSYNIGLFLNQDCTGPKITWNNNFVWNVDSVGTYYPCVQGEGNKHYRAGTITVTAAPAVTFSRSPGVRGMGVIADVTRGGLTGTIRVGVATTVNGRANTNPCDNMMTSGTTTATGKDAEMLIPMEAPLGAAVYCVSTPYQHDNAESVSAAYHYPFGPYGLHTYKLTHDPLLADTTATIILDSSVTLKDNSKMRLVPEAAGCGDTAYKNNIFNVGAQSTALNPVKFPTPGAWLLCIMEPNMLGGSYNGINKLSVYGPAKATPTGVVTGVPAEVTISEIPPNTPVYVTAKATCDASNADKLLSGTSDATGNATLTGTVSVKGDLTVCVGYTGENKGDDVVMLKGTNLLSAPPVVSPNYVVADQPSRLTIRVPDTTLLVDDLAFFVPKGSPCVDNGNNQQQIISQGETTADMPFVVVSMPYTENHYTVCVGRNDVYVPAGDVSVLKALTMKTDPTPGAYGLTMTAAFTGESLVVLNPTKYAVIASTVSCSLDLNDDIVYARGDLTTAFQTSLFFVPETVQSITVCVGNANSMATRTAGYVFGGTADLVRFTSRSRYAQIGLTNNLQGFPMSPDGELFLVPCAGTTCNEGVSSNTCKTATKQYITSKLQKLEGAAPGMYVLCQRSTTFPNALMGSDNTVEVVQQWKVTASESPLRQYKPFTVTISGGPAVNPTGGYSLRAQPASVPCDTVADESQTFTGLPGGKSPELVITDIDPIQEIHFCLIASQYDSISVLKTNLDHYMSPAVIVTDAPPTKITTPLKTGFAKLSTTTACADMVTTKVESVTSNAAMMSVSGCTPLSNANLRSAYYCESTNGGDTYELRGKMVIFHPSGCTEGEDGSISSVSVPPAQKIDNFGLDDTFLPNPRLSTTSDCNNKIEANVAKVGYSPEFDQNAVFFVCANLKAAPSITVTSLQPTLKVLNWVASPTCVISRPSGVTGVKTNTELTVDYPTPSQQTFLSTTRACNGKLTDASGLGTSSKKTIVSTTGVNGMVYVCTADSLTLNQIAVAEFLSVTPPTVTKSSPAIIRGATYSARLVVRSYNGENPLYSMHPGTDETFPYRPYFVSMDRDVFLSPDSSCSRVLTDTSKTIVNNDNDASFATQDIAVSVTQVDLCAGTPAGNAVALANVQVAPGEVFPVQFVTGGESEIYIPNYVGTEFKLSHSNSDCSAINDDLPAFTIGPDGTANMVLHTGPNKEPAPTGTYTLCYQSGGMVPLSSTITVFPPVHFDVRGLTYVVAVPGVMELIHDLETKYLLPGFSTSRTCTDPSNRYGSWEQVSTTSILVTAQAPFPTLYLCAITPINNTIVSLPAGNAKIEFVASSPLVPPPGGAIDACNGHTYDKCAAPGTSPADGVLAVVYGDCCNMADRQNTIGATRLNANGGCRLTVDRKAASVYPKDTTYSMCVWSDSDLSYCTTTGSVKVDFDCVDNFIKDDKGIGRGWTIALIVLGCILGLLLLLFLAWLLWYCCCRTVAKDVAEERQLVALRQMECSEYEGSGGNAPRHHPLMYYPTSQTPSLEQQEIVTGTRSISNSPQQSESSPPQTLVESIEDDERDQIALEEARTRYQMRLHFTEQLEKLKLQEKEDEVDVGYEFDEEVPAGRAAPVLRPVEAIDRDESTFPEYDEYTRDECATHIDDDHQLVLDEGDEEEQHLRESTSPIEQRRVRSRSIESSRPSIPRERRGSLLDSPDAQAQAMDALRASEHETPRPAVREQQQQQQPQKSSKSPTPLIREQTPHIDPMQATAGSVRSNSNSPVVNKAEAPTLASEESSAAARALSYPTAGSSTGDHTPTTTSHPHAKKASPPNKEKSRSPSNEDAKYPEKVYPTQVKPQHEDRYDDADEYDEYNADERYAPAPNNTTNKPVDDYSGSNNNNKYNNNYNNNNNNIDNTHEDNINDSSVENESPHDISGAAVYPMAFEPHPAARQTFNSAYDVVEDEDLDDDLDDPLSYTTTQRFYDEARFLREQEDIRRQRLSNWEEEERAALAQEELDNYMTIARTDNQAVDCYTSSSSMEDDDIAVEDDDIYAAPERPAALPPLPPVPVPHTPMHYSYKPESSSVMSSSGLGGSPSAAVADTARPPQGAPSQQQQQWMRYGQQQQREGVDYDEIVEL